jgi:hypothetical protein
METPAMRLLAVPMLTLAAASLLATPAGAAQVNWADWTSGTAGANGTATGVFSTAGGLVDIDYSGEIAFIQTGIGTNYFSPGTPYVSALVDNAPTAAEMIALSTATSKTLTFSKPVDNLFFAVVSLNGNGYQFNQDFEIVSTGCGFWGCGGLARVDLGNGQYQANSTGGEPHGVIRFTGAVSSITWTSLSNENWNGFTVGTYGLAPPPIPEPGTWALMALGLAGVAAAARRRRGG